MDDVVEPVHPLMVHQVALSTLNAAEDGDDWCLYPIIAVWADLSPLTFAGAHTTEGAEVSGIPVLVVTDSVLDSLDPATMTVVVARAHWAPADDEDEQAPTGDFPHAPVAPFGPHWTLRLPTAWVGMATTVLGTPLQLRIILIDGHPPADPATHVVDLAEATAMVMPTYEAVHPQLHHVMADDMATPLPMQMARLDGDDHTAPINLMRDLLWTNIAGIALGQDRALNRMLDYAEWVDRLDPDDPADGARFMQAMEAADWVADSSNLEPLDRDNAGNMLWPAAMGPLVEKIEQHTSAPAIDALDDGAPFEMVADLYGTQAALFALAVAVAARANTASADVPPEDVPQGRYTPAYLTAMWLDEDCDTPWWATRATHHLLLHHDIDTLVDLLVCNPEARSLSEGHGPLSYRLLHVLTEALASTGLSVEEFTRQAHALDVTPVGFEDVLHVCQRLLGSVIEGPDTGECPGCVAAQTLINETVDQPRLVRATAAAMPLLADLDAQVRGLPVGDEEWRTHRDGFLMHWMNHTAFVAQDQ